MTNWLWVVSPVVLLLIAVAGAAYKLGAWKGGVDRALKALHKSIRRLDKKIDSLPFPPVAVASGGPLRLTEFSKELSQCVGAREWATELAPSLSEEVRAKVPYKVQEMCDEYTKALPSKGMESDRDRRLKDCAFRNGVPIETFLQVLSIELRDQLLQERAD